jgi:hypothetical protein
MDARRATPLDMDLPADLDATDLTFPVRTRFIDCPLIRSVASICLAYGNIKIQHLPRRRQFPMHSHANWRLISRQIGRFLADFLDDLRFGGIARQIFSDTPKNAPNPRWLAQIRAGRHWARKSRASTDFREIFSDFGTSVDVTGRLWSWDGWDSNPGPKP